MEYFIPVNDESIRAISKIRGEFVEQLLFEKERFSRVFKTSNGSTYFHLKTGQTLRAKIIPDQYEFMIGEGKHLKFQPIMRELFFVSQEEADRLKEGFGRNRQFLPAEEIVVTEYGLGASPFELNVVYDSEGATQVVFEKKDNKLLLKGSEWKDLHGIKNFDAEQLVGGIHLGNPIVEVLK